MTGQGLLQLALYLGVLVLLVKPLGAFMANVYEGKRTIPLAGPRPGRAGHLSRGGHRRDAGERLEALRARRAALQPDRRRRRLPAAAPAGRAAAQSAGLWRGNAGLVLQHGRELRHQHELAGLRRRDHDELSHADARARGAELRVGGVRHGGPGRADPRVRAAPGRRDRQLLGGPHAQHALHPAAAVARARDRPRLAGCRAELRRLPAAWNSPSLDRRGSEPTPGR